MADLAGGLGLEAAQLLADPGGVGLAPAALEVGQDALEGLGDLIFAGVVVIGEFDLLGPGAAQDDGPGLFREVAPGQVHREAVVAAERLQGLGVERGRTARPGGDGALVQGLVAVGDDQVGVEGQFDAEAVAGRAGAERVVEREQPRLDLADRKAGHRAGEFLGEGQAARLLFAVRDTGPFGHSDTVGQTEGGLQAVGIAAFQPGLGDDPVHDDVDVVLELLVEDRSILDGVEFAVDLDALEAHALPFGHFLAVFALATADDGGEQQQALSLGQGAQLVDHHGDGLALDRQAGGR